jgi:hypothetical protein
LTEDAQVQPGWNVNLAMEWSPRLFTSTVALSGLRVSSGLS